MENYLNNFIVLFSVVDPIGVAWLFGAMTHGTPRREQRQMAIRATLFASGILLLFLLTGTRLLDWFGITIPAFRIAGGALLFLLSIDMVFARHSGLRSTTTTERDEALHKHDVSIFPLAFPLLAGPGAPLALRSEIVHWFDIVAAARADHPLHSKRRSVTGAQLAATDLIMRRRGSGTLDVIEMALAEN